MVDIATYRARIGTFTMPRKVKGRLRVLCVEKSSISVILRLAIVLSVLVTLGGDVELNPGPRGRSMRQSTLSFVDDDMSQSSQSTQSTQETRPRNVKNTKDSEVMSFLREMKTDMRADLSDINSKITSINKSLNTLKEENESLKRENREIKAALSAVSSKLDKLEGHSRRNNLRFLGIKGKANESWEESEKVVRKFLSEKLSMTNSETVPIERAHRVGSRHSEKCTIVAKFSSYKDREDILKRSRTTLGRDSGYTVREDYTDRVLLHRRELSKKLVTAREQGQYASLRYDKLIVDGSVYKYCDQTEQIILIGAARGRDNYLPRNTTYRDTVNRTGQRVETSVYGSQDTNGARDHGPGQQRDIRADQSDSEDEGERGAIGGLR